MKTPKYLLLLLTVLSVSCISAISAPPTPSEANDKSELPYKIVSKAERSHFYGDNRITITEVRGDRPLIEPGGTYLVTGTYTLASASGARLCLFLSTDGSSSNTPMSKDQSVQVAQGAGKFTLKETIQEAGSLHVTLYALHGGSSLAEVHLGHTAQSAYADTGRWIPKDFLKAPPADIRLPPPQGGPPSLQQKADPFSGQWDPFIFVKW